MHPTSYLLPSIVLITGVFAQSDRFPELLVPSACQDSCSGALSIVDQCRQDWDGSQDNPNYISCLCNATNARNDIPACQDCLWGIPGVDDDDYDDWWQLVNRCSFVTTSNAPANATPTPVTTTTNSSGTTNNQGTSTTPNVVTQAVNAGARAQMPLSLAGIGAAVAAMIF